MIVETYRIQATNTDVLASPSRLAAMPQNGTLTLEFQSTVWGSLNQFALQIKMPDGSTPIDGAVIPAGVTTGAINSMDKYVVQIPVVQGGHVFVSLTLTGTSVCHVRATLMP